MDASETLKYVKLKWVFLTHFLYFGAFYHRINTDAFNISVGVHVILFPVAVSLGLGIWRWISR